jgi:hypothetical protein
MLLLLHRVKPSLANQFDQKWVNHNGVTHNLELIFLFPSLFFLTAPVNYFFLSLFNMGFGPSSFLKKKPIKRPVSDFGCAVLPSLCMTDSLGFHP